MFTEITPCLLYARHNAIAIYTLISFSPLSNPTDQNNKTKH